MSERSVVGDLINFRGLVYAPLNENGVIFLFGRVLNDLNMYIEEVRGKYPDCRGRRFTGRGWEEVFIEFEHKSSNFEDHGHDPENCDIIVCWEHDWEDCPLEVIELKKEIKELEERPIKRPRAEAKEYDLEENLQSVSQEVRPLFYELDETIKNTSEEVWRKTTSRGVTYYSPERVFIYNDFQKSGFKLTVFTRGSPLKGVKEIDYEGGGEKWGHFHVNSNDDLGKLKTIVEESYDRMRKAIENNENTGWYAEVEREKEELS